MIRITRTRVAAIAAVLALLVVANVVPGHRAAAQTVTVQIVNQGNTWAFSPLQITVLAGTTITWQNVSSAPHTATSDPGSPAAFDTGTIPAGGQASVTLTVPGTYTYFCAIHPPPLMARGSIVVMAAGQKQWDQLRDMVRGFQTACQRMKYASVPVVAALALVLLAGTGALGGRLGGAPIRRAALRVLAGGSLAMLATWAIGSLVGTAV